jgi:SAM-dependent methyltransferase
MDSKAVYDKYNWEHINYEHLEGKIVKVLDWIPGDVKTIVDVGCGNGVITNILGEKYEVTGVDRSEVALQSVKTKKLAASASSIPLPDHCCDLVFSSELLEHLDDDTLTGTVSEMMRLTRKYIFITVPNDENPDKLAIQCTECGYIYNSPNHLRSFRPTDLKQLFPDFKMTRTAVDGKKIRYYNRGILNLKKRFTPSASWIPEYWMKKDLRQTICPKCEHQFQIPYRFNALAFSFDVLNVVLSPKKPYWLFVLLEKKNPSL